MPQLIFNKKAKNLTDTFLSYRNFAISNIGHVQTIR